MLTNASIVGFADRMTRVIDPLLVNLCQQRRIFNRQGEDMGEITPKDDMEKTGKRKDSCLWTRQDADSEWWSTSCGEEYYINFGIPTEQKMKFCCFCGRQLKEQDFDRKGE